MIRIRKPDIAPQVLRERGATLTAELCRRVEAGEQPEFDRGTYGAEQVKEALSAAQHDKCCFCESKLGHAQFGDVEHFRPKGRARQRRDDEPTTGYYWLVYAWDNLYLSCAVCNQRHKGDLFPLANPEHRVSTHHRASELEAEQPLFVDPGREEPAQFIEFRREYAAPMAGSTRGRTTLESLQLNRKPLLERRRDHRQMVLACIVLLARVLHTELITDDDRRDAILALSIIIAAASDGGMYAATIRALLRHVAPWWTAWNGAPSALLDALRGETSRGQRFQLGEL